MSYDDTICTLNDCAKRNLRHRHKASALWVNDCLHVQSVQPYLMEAWLEVKGCSGEGSVATSNRRVLTKHYDEFLEECSDDLRISQPALLRWAYRREGHPLHEAAVGLVEAVNALSDYPLVDEMDLSDLEYEWAEEAVSEAFDEAVKEAIEDATREFSGIYDDTDFNLEHFREGWIRDAMSSEWWAHEKDNVRFTQMEGDTRLGDAIKRVINQWRDEFRPDEDLDPLDAEVALARIAELSGQKWSSPAHTLEAWRAVVAIITNPRSAL